MSYMDAMNRMLPPRDGVSAHITGHYGETRDRGPHGGSDFNYVGGQTGINLQHPTLHAPISGVVTFSGGQYGTVKIRDAAGNSHEILHMHTRSVEAGQRIEAGDAIGTMGGRGPSGPNQYAQHVHYQLKDATGRLMNPEAFWDARQVDLQTQIPQARLVSDPAHPRHALYAQTLDAVHRMEVERCMRSGSHSERLAGALTVEAIREGLIHIDRVELNDRGTLVRAVQVSCLRDEPCLNRVTDAIGTQSAINQTLRESSEQVDRSWSERQSQQDALQRQPPQPMQAASAM